MYKQIFLWNKLDWRTSAGCYQGKNSDTCLENIPLSRDDTLDEDAEKEEEGLVHGGEVHPDVEGEEEHQLDEEAGVDEDVGEAGADPDGNTGGGAPVQGEGEPEWRAQQQTWRWENS